jgi:hypothetical protein
MSGNNIITNMQALAVSKTPHDYRKVVSHALANYSGNNLRIIRCPLIIGIASRNNRIVTPFFVGKLQSGVVSLQQKRNAKRTIIE